MKITFLEPERLELPATMAPPSDTLDTPSALAAPKPSADRWIHRAIRLAAKGFSSACLFLVPVLPPVMALLLWDRRFIKDYRAQRAKFQIHFKALSQGPVEHFFNDVFLRFKHVPVTVHGECVQCGNCCLNRQCAFLEPIADGKFQCGIYGSYLRRFSNCGSFPLHAHDIERYQCPSYFVEADPKVRWIQPVK
jgi:hypothetical protein